MRSLFFVFAPARVFFADSNSFGLRKSAQSRTPRSLSVKNWLVARAALSQRPIISPVTVQKRFTGKTQNGKSYKGSKMSNYIRFDENCWGKLFVLFFWSKNRFISRRVKVVRDLPTRRMTMSGPRTGQRARKGKNSWWRRWRRLKAR